MVENWTFEELTRREKEMAAEVAESEAAKKQPGAYVSRKCLADDRRFLRELRREIKDRLEERYCRG